MPAKLSEAELERRVKGLYDYAQVEVPKAAVETRLESFGEISLGYTDEEAFLEAQRCMQCQDPPCVKACPAHLNVPAYTKAIVEGDLKKGLQIIMDTYPLPGTCGRICFHPCTDVCLKGLEGQPINIPRLRRYLADRVSQYELDYHILPSTGKKIAIVGSGPAGLTCAYHLVRSGHKVVVFERDEKPGGTLNTIPDYRLPNYVLQDEIKVLEWLGVGIRTGVAVGGEGCIDALLKEYDAVFIAAGAVGSWKLNIEGKDLEGTITALDYLRAVDRGEVSGSLPQGKKVAIIGGGNVAMDALRTALRQADEVHFLYRRSPQEMPATADETVELAEELLFKEMHALEMELASEWRGEHWQELRSRYEKLTFERRKEVARRIEERLRSDVFEKLATGSQPNIGKLTVHFLTQPTRVLGDTRVTGVECMKMALGEPDASGRRQPVPIPGSEFILSADAVIFAVGQNVESGWLGQDSGIALKKYGEIIIDESTGQTSRDRVFAGGDAVRGPSSMIEAIADGKRAAEAIDRLLATPSGDS